MRSIPGFATVRRAALLAAGSGLVPTMRRASLLRTLGMRNLTDVTIGRDVTFADPSAVTMGAGAFVNNGTYFDAGPVTLGSRVYVGPRAVFITGDHSIGGPQQRAGDGEHAPITVGDGAWIGAGAIILPGLTIGEGCVIGAGAVVTKDCAPHGVYTGVPAQRLRDLRGDGERDIPREVRGDR